jgi:CRP-like cAMP-binding protein
LEKTFIFNGCSPGFLEEIVLEMKPKLVMPRVMLTAEGDVGHEFFMIAKGSVDVTIAGNWMRRLEQGEFFGEIAIFMKSGRRTATTFSKSYADLFSIKKSAFVNLIFDFPADAQEFLEVAKYRFNNTED